ncbi:PREDICTED: uncharacterized protein LOC109238704 [Nicotiana attenuata]|uniref:F-boxkelch-repeat protein n=1 Tax=Nicotiana attenuata TaxID=49451 RepID=A0A314LBJ6_NICAT|nr:PREDICTED: uncharacterized protein LOC109238704 [Nicotiana attenuata]OIT38986.1 hypothetical protein A4A49_05514 [Nicotiana attenuata]
MAKQLRRQQIYVHCMNGRKHLWYCINFDSESSTVELSQVAPMELEFRGDWAIVGNHIYWAGGIKNPEPSDMGIRLPYSSMELYRHDITSTDPVSWVPVSSSKKLHRHEACVVSLDKTIYVLGGKKFPYEGDEYEGRYCGEAYDIDSFDTKSWKLMALNVQDFATFTSSTTAFVKGEGEVVCYSILTGHLLIYNIHEDGFKFQVHPHFNFRVSRSPSGNSLPNGLDDGDLDKLIYVVINVRPVVSNSTLYWFANNLILYGYDFSEKRWFKSTSLQGMLWELPFPDDAFPVLVQLCRTDFVLIAPLSSGKLGVAHLVVFRNTRSLDVSVELLSTLSVDDPVFVPVDGIAIPVDTEEPATKKGSTIKDKENNKKDKGAVAPCIMAKRVRNAT